MLDVVTNIARRVDRRYERDAPVWSRSHLIWACASLHLTPMLACVMCSFAIMIVHVLLSRAEDVVLLVICCRVNLFFDTLLGIFAWGPLTAHAAQRYNPARSAGVHQACGHAMVRPG